MKKVLKRLGAIIVAMLMLLSCNSAVFAYESGDSLANGAVDYWSGNGIIKNDPANNGETAIYLEKDETAMLDTNKNFSGSVLVEAEVYGSAGNVAVLQNDEKKTQLAVIDFSSVLKSDEWTNVQIVVHKEVGKYAIYSEGKYITEGTFTAAFRKNMQYFTFTATGENGLYLKNVKISRYVSKYKESQMDTVFSTDFTKYSTGTSIKDISGWKYASVANDVYKIAEIDGSKALSLERKDWNKAQYTTTLNKNFSVSTQLYIPSTTDTVRFQLYAGAQRFAEIGSWVNKDDNSVYVGMIDDKATEIPIEVPEFDTWFTWNLYVDIDAQMVMVNWEDERGNKSSTVRYEFDPVHAGDGETAATSFTDLYYAVVGTNGQKMYCKDITLKMAKSQEVLFEDNFDEDLTKWSHSIENDTETTMEILSTGKNNENLGSNAMLLQRKVYTNSTGLNGTVFDTDGDGEMDIDAKPGQKPNSGVVYAELSKPITYADDVYVTYKLYRADYARALVKTGNVIGDNGKYIYSGTSRDCIYISLSSEKKREDYYTSAQNGELKMYGNTKNVSHRTQLSKVDWNAVQMQMLNSNTNLYLRFSSSSYDAKSCIDPSLTNKELKYITMSIESYNGGAYYIDDVKVYSPIKSQFKVMDMTDQYTQVVYEMYPEAVKIDGFKLRGEDDVLTNLAAGQKVEKITLTKYTSVSSPKIIVGLYSDNGTKLVDCAIAEVKDNYEQKDITLSKALDVKDGNTMKIFVFESFTTLKPIMGVTSY